MAKSTAKKTASKESVTDDYVYFAEKQPRITRRSLGNTYYSTTPDNRSVYRVHASEAENFEKHFLVRTGAIERYHGRTES